MLMISKEIIVFNNSSIKLSSNDVYVYNDNKNDYVDDDDYVDYDDINVSFGWYANKQNEIREINKIFNLIYMHSEKMLIE